MYHNIRKQLADHALSHLKNNYAEQLRTQPLLQQIAAKWEQNKVIMDDDLLAKEYKVIYLDILNQQREWLLQKNNDDKIIDEEIIRKHFRHLDLEEEKLQFL